MYVLLLITPITRPQMPTCDFQKEDGTMKLLRLLFIGNSHTYCNDMPLYVRAMARECGFDCEVTMLAHGGWYLEQHANEPDVRFNILYGKYDYVRCPRMSRRRTCKLSLLNTPLLQTHQASRRVGLSRSRVEIFEPCGCSKILPALTMS